MTLTTYLLYVAAVALLILTPGPTMLMCMTNALNHGPRKAMTSVSGSVSAVLCVMLLSAMGLGALLAASETAFTVAKVIGAAYLIWLGIKTFRSEAAVLQSNPEQSCEQTLLRSEGPPRASNGPLGGQGATRSERPWGSHFLRGFLVGASNPKAVLFFAAFFPQFLNPTAPFVPQFTILALTFMAFEFTVLTCCALGVSRIAPLLRSNRAVRWFNRVSGGLFTLMGSLLLLTRRHA
ncbi:LysE family translocator [Polaromonas jejuensis]|uniref:LysE family translocator n=1 Tax=Polaromonas jejuensis TaxID=457502 RepID=A0ABW0QLC1_9BURK|nr:LysE family translocator [Polaromonas jejuensis]